MFGRFAQWWGFKRSGVQLESWAQVQRGDVLKWANNAWCVVSTSGSEDIQGEKFWKVHMRSGENLVSVSLAELSMYMSDECPPVLLSGVDR